jgi:glycosyltransferase involved in cell wall biosynthesis
VRICIVAFSGLFPITIGGPGSVAYFLSKWLGIQGDEVTLFFRISKEEQRAKIGQYEQLKLLKNVNMLPVVLDYNRQALANVPLFAQKVFKITERFQRDHFDLVHYNSPPIDASLLFPTISRLRKEKQTITIHGGIFEERKYALGRLLMRIERSLFDKVIVLNAFSRRLASFGGFEQERMVTIPNGIDVDLIKQAEAIDLPGDPKILYVGRLVDLKGVDVLLRAFASLVKDLPSAHLFLVGDGPSKTYLKHLAWKLRIDDRVVFEGFKPTMEVYRYYKSVNVLVLPSYIENFSLSLLEGMASKTPVVVSDAEGNLEIVSNGDNGLVFRRGDHRMLCQQIRLIVTNPDYAHKIASIAYSKAEKEYDWTVVGSLYRSVFKSLAD